MGLSSTVCLACSLALSFGAAAGAQGIDINELLRGGADPARPHGATPTVPPAELLRGLPTALEADVGNNIPPAPPVAPFPTTALIGRWTGAGESCADRHIGFIETDSGFLGESTLVDPVDGHRITTRFETTEGTVLTGAPHPDDPTRFFSYARLYPAKMTRRDGSGSVLDLIEDFPVTLIVSRTDADLILRFVEPVTACRYVHTSN